MEDVGDTKECGTLDVVRCKAGDDVTEAGADTLGGIVEEVGNTGC